LLKSAKGADLRKMNKDNLNCPFEDSQLFQKHHGIPADFYGSAGFFYPIVPASTHEKNFQNHLVKSFHFNYNPSDT